MPDLKMKKKINKFNKTGKVHENQAFNMMERTWYRDPAVKTCYFFDYTHEFDPFMLNDIDISKYENILIPVECKYIINQSQTLAKDKVSYHIQFKPSFVVEEITSYYKELFIDRYESEAPCGLYVLVPDSKGRYNRWCVVDSANGNDPLFPTYEILRCDYTACYILENKIWQVAGVKRSQNSYNSGIWSEYVTSSQEDQIKFIVPLNRDTEKIFHVDEKDKNLEIIMDANVLTRPMQWQVSKVSRVSPKGLVLVTLFQTEYNQNTAAILGYDNKFYRPWDFDKSQNVKAWFANYYSSHSIKEPLENNISDNIYAEIKYSGLKPQVVVGGNYKKFTVNFYNDNNLIDFIDGTWSAYRYYTDSNNERHIDNDSITFINNDNTSQSIKIKIKNDTSYIGSVLVVGFKTTDEKYETSLECEIIGL